MTYASTTGLSRTNSYGRNQNNIDYLNRRLVLGPISNFVILLVLTCLLAVFYLSQVTKTNSYSYIINDFDGRHQTLVDEHRSLVIRAAQLKATGRINHSLAETNLVEPAAVYYVTD